MKNTGALLKSKRESSNLSISEVALATKINPKILAAMEAGETTNLPSKTILKGFVRSYALFLKMDVDEVLRAFQEDTGGPPPGAERAIVEPARSETPSRRRVDEENSSGLRTAAVVVIVLLIGLIIGVRELIEKYQREKVVETSVAEQVSPIPEGAQIKDVTITAEPATAPEKTEETKPEETKPEATEAAKPAETEPGAKPAVKPTLHEQTRVAEMQPVEERPAEKTPEKPAEPAVNIGKVDRAIPNSIRKEVPFIAEMKPLQMPVRPPQAVGAPPLNFHGDMPAREAAPESAPVTTTEATPATKPPTPAPSEASLAKAVRNEIILEALDKVEVKFQVKGETKRVSLGPTQVHTIRADSPLTIDFSDGGAVNVILNGRERGVPGDLGKPKTIKIP
ncbi:MAG TPA: helix-turn-helix domain-containing protein [Bdellovibrionales bacterium]|nr:helix-turn-helix domain-containing protein [Bdellovibrionales bacterium]